MGGKRWTSEELDYLKEYVHGTNYKEMYCEFVEKFNSKRSYMAFIQRLEDIGIDCIDRPEWTDEEDKFIIDNCSGRSIKELTRMHNERFDIKRTFSACKTRVYDLGCKTGRDTRMQGEDDRRVCHEIGTITKDSVGNLWIKTSIKQKEKGDSGGKILYMNYTRLDIYNWEKENGKLNDGEWLYHIDGNKENCDVNNLRIITRRIHGGLHADNFHTLEDPDLRNCAVDYEILKFTVKDVKK